MGGDGPRVSWAGQASRQTREAANAPLGEKLWYFGIQMRKSVQKEQQKQEQQESVQSRWSIDSVQESCAMR